MSDKAGGTAIGLVAVTAAGRRHAAALAAAWPGQARLIEAGSAADALRAAWTSCDAIVAFLATGAVVRLVAPLLVAGGGSGERGSRKLSDPAVVVVDEAGQYAVALLGGHHGGGAGGGANALAASVGEVLGARPVITTATDATGVPGLDTLGWPVEGAVATVSRAVLDGDQVALVMDAVWPLPALPGNVSVVAGGPGVGASAKYQIVVTELDVATTELDVATVVLRPPSLVVGIGSSRGVSADEVGHLLDGVLAAHGLSPASVRCLVTADVKADEAGLVELARRRGLPLITHPAQVLAEVAVPNPSEVVLAAVGTPSVAEAAALLGERSARGAELVVPKTASAMATVAIARHRPRGRLALVGLGPGARDLLTEQARTELRRAGVVVGLDQYVDQVRDLLRPGTRVLASGLGQEEARARAAVDEANAGHAVALLGSGDAGVYAMASPALEYAGENIDVVGVPGVTAGLAAAALLGAPLGHDHTYLSLSDLHTPWQAIERRVRAAAEGDYVVLFYNPRSQTRAWQLPAALRLLAEHRPPSTPVGVVRNATREGQTVSLSTLAEFDPSVVDMYSLVVVGSSQTVVVAGRMVTPRGYRWRS